MPSFSHNKASERQWLRAGRGPMTSVLASPDARVIFAIMNINHAQCKLHASNRPSRASRANPRGPIVFESESTDDPLAVLGSG